MPCRSRAIVVVVVPTVAEDEQRDDEIVAALIWRRIAPEPEAMTDGICRPDRMVDPDRTEDAAPNDELPAAGAGGRVDRPPDLADPIEQCGISKVQEVGIALKTHQFRKTGEVCNEPSPHRD